MLGTTDVKQSGTNTGKPWSLRGREAEIAQMRDGEGKSFEEIAFRMGASKQGVIGAYNRFSKPQKELDPVPSTNPGPDQIEACAPTSNASVAQASMTNKEE